MSNPAEPEPEIVRANARAVPARITLSEVAGSVLDQVADRVADGVREYERLIRENARLMGLVEVLARENEWLRSMLERKF